MLVAFAVWPSTATEGDSVRDAVAAAVKVVRASGLPNRTDSMFTTIEGEWDEVFDVIHRAADAVGDQRRGGQRTDAFHAAAEDRIVDEQLLHLAEQLQGTAHVRARQIGEAVRQVGADAADADVVAGDAPAAQRIDEIPDQLARLQG